MTTKNDSTEARELPLNAQAALTTTPTQSSVLSPQSSASRLGFAAKVLGNGGMKDFDSRRWQSAPHLSVSLGFLHVIFDYLASEQIRMYRISSNIAPYLTHPDLPQFHNQLVECADELAALGTRARDLDLRVSMHPSQYIVLNSPDERIVAASVRDFAAQSEILDRMGMPADCKVVTHVGGVYGDRQAAADRFCVRYEALPDAVRRRLVLENDEVSWPVTDIVAIHDRVGIPLVFDILHHRVNNPEGLSEVEAFRRCHAAWPVDQTPKMHYSTQRSAEREVVRRNRVTKERKTSLQAAKAGQHDDWIDPDDFLAFLAATVDLRYDVMLEAKQKDLALLRLRESVAAAGLRSRIW